MARILCIPFLIGTMIVVYCIYVLEMEELSIYLIPLILIPAALFIFAPKIDWWWLRRNPPALAPELKNLLLERNNFYAGLEAHDKKRFEDRVALYSWGREFIPKEIEQVGADLKMICAQYAVQVTLNKSDFLVGEIDRVVLYKHPFISPNYPRDFHSSELHKEDGVFIFSADRLMPGFLEPGLYFSVGAYEYAKAYLGLYPEARLSPEAESAFREYMSEIGFPEAYVIQFVGLTDIDWQAVAISYYFAFGESMQQVAPTLHQYFEDLFQPKVAI